MAGELVVVRHADTDWTVSGRHTGRTDIPLNEAGRAKAVALAPRARRPRVRRGLEQPALARARDGARSPASPTRRSTPTPPSGTTATTTG